VRDVELTEPEWFAKAIEFLTKTGQMCSGKRQEFILLSDVMGISMLVDLVAHARPAAATESTVFGPFHREGVRPNCLPEATSRTSIRTATPTVVKGRVLEPRWQPN
jgi:hydroxyquinol 1,2-dioxygenase